MGKGAPPWYHRFPDPVLTSSPSAGVPKNSTHPANAGEALSLMAFAGSARASLKKWRAARHAHFGGGTHGEAVV